jgi:hypothetical protein
VLFSGHDGQGSAKMLWRGRRRGQEKGEENVR